MQVWSEQGATWGSQQVGKPKGWLGLGRWLRAPSAEEQLQGRWVKLARKLDRECETLRRRMERGI